MTLIPEILLIEDSKDDRDLFAMALSSSGVRAVLSPAFSVSEALQRISRQSLHADSLLPALIIIEIALPGRDGIALLQLFQRLLQGHAVPIVVLTGSQLESHRLRCLELGIGAFHRKPGVFAELVALVTALGRFLPRADSPPSLSIARQVGA